MTLTELYVSPPTDLYAYWLLGSLPVEEPLGVEGGAERVLMD